MTLTVRSDGESYDLSLPWKDGRDDRLGSTVVHLNTTPHDDDIIMRVGTPPCTTTLYISPKGARALSEALAACANVCDGLPSTEGAEPTYYQNTHYMNDNCPGGHR